MQFRLSSIQTKIASQQSPSECVRGARICAQAPPQLYSLASDVKFFTSGQVSLNFSLCPPIPLWLHGKNVISILCFQCCSVWQCLGGCRSKGCHGQAWFSLPLCSTILLGTIPQVHLLLMSFNNEPQREEWRWLRLSATYIKLVKGKLMNMTQKRNKENIWVPDRNQTHDLPNTRQALYPPSYENSWRESSFKWVHMWQAPCILLGSALLKSSWVVISE